MIHLFSFIAYLKFSWVKRFLSNPSGGWQSILMSILNQFGGARVLTLQKCKIQEISTNISNLFWKSVLDSLSLAKPVTKINIKECLSLDILNFIEVKDFSHFLKLN